MKRIFVIIILFLIISNSFNIEQKKYLRPFSIVFNFFYSPFFNIYNPEFKNLSISVSATFDNGLSFQYRFSKFIGIDQGLFLNLGFDLSEAHYFESNNLTKYSQNIFCIFLDMPLNLVIYIPINKELKNNYNIIFLFKTGLVLELWVYSLYRITKDFILIQEGSFHDNIVDGPNQFERSVDYSKIINLVNLGINLGMAFKFHSNKFLSIYPELGVKFFILPTLYGYNERIGGYDTLLSRNDGKLDKTLFDFKISFYTGMAISLDFGKAKDNLYNILELQDWI